MTDSDSDFRPKPGLWGTLTPTSIIMRSLKTSLHVRETITIYNVSLQYCRNNKSTTLSTSVYLCTTKAQKIKMPNISNIFNSYTFA